MCSTIASIVKRTGFTVQVFPLRCRAWTCPTCAPMRRKQLIRQAKSGKPNRFVTLTVNPAHGNGPDDRALQLTRAWRDVVREYRRQHPAWESQYMAVFETTKRGEPHLHIMWRGGWIDQKWLSKQMRIRIGAPVVDVRMVREEKNVAEYCAKYISKRPIRLGSCKRYWRSTKYLPESEAARKARLKAGSWFYKVDMGCQRLIDYFKSNGAVFVKDGHGDLIGAWLPDEEQSQSP